VFLFFFEFIYFLSCYSLVMGWPVSFILALFAPPTHSLHSVSFAERFEKEMCSRLQTLLVLTKLQTSAARVPGRRNCWQPTERGLVCCCYVTVFLVFILFFISCFFASHFSCVCVCVFVSRLCIAICRVKSRKEKRKKRTAMKRGGTAVVVGAPRPVAPCTSMSTSLDAFQKPRKSSLLFYVCLCVCLLFVFVFELHSAKKNFTFMLATVVRERERERASERERNEMK